MKITELKSNPESLIYMERYVDGGGRTYSSYSHVLDIDPLYQPTSNNVSFPLPCMEVPKSEVNIYRCSPTSFIENLFMTNETVLFPIHPETLTSKENEHLEKFRSMTPKFYLPASPTASSRTLLFSQNEHKAFVKVHLPKQISRFVRSYRDYHIRQGAQVTKELQSLQYSKLAYLPETLGISIGQEKNSFGFCIREMTPRPYVQDKRYLIPMFSLYAQDIHQPNDLPLLVQLIDYHRIDPTLFTFEHIFYPMIKGWCELATQLGLLFPAHAQNVLLEVNEDLFPTRIVYRDLDLHVDTLIREANGLHLHFTPNRLKLGIEEKREKLYGLFYDSFMGHHFFEYISTMLEKYYGIRPQKIQKMCQDVFSEHFPQYKKFFSSQVYYYSDNILSENQYQLVATPSLPQWRPYL